VMKEFDKSNIIKNNEWRFYKFNWTKHFQITS
jgi:hypothetical protein